MMDDDIGQGHRQADRTERMECKKDTNLASCNCSWPSCSRKGACCDCITYHRESRELPACMFPEEAERSYDRTFEHFAKLVREGKV
jgi:hypothetical protein